jgi:hypothetical protein
MRTDQRMRLSRINLVKLKRSRMSCEAREHDVTDAASESSVDISSFAISIAHQYRHSFVTTFSKTCLHEWRPCQDANGNAQGDSFGAQRQIMRFQVLWTAL